MEDLKYNFFTSLEDLQNEFENKGYEVAEINEEYITIQYTKNGEDIEESYKLFVTYSNNKPSTILLSDLKYKKIL